MVIDKNDKDFGAILICAVRYALGRRTYMPSLVCEWIQTSCKGQLDLNTLKVLAKDIEDFGKPDPAAYGDTWDERTWKNMLNWCRREIGQRNA